MQRNDSNSLANHNASSANSNSQDNNNAPSSANNLQHCNVVIEITTMVDDALALFKEETHILNGLQEEHKAALEEHKVALANYRDLNAWRSYLVFLKNVVMPKLNESLRNRNLPEINEQLLAGNDFSGRCTLDNLNLNPRTALLYYCHSTLFLCHVIDKLPANISIPNTIKINELNKIKTLCNELFNYIQSHPQYADMYAFRILLVDILKRLVNIYNHLKSIQGNSIFDDLLCLLCQLEIMILKARMVDPVNENKMQEPLILDVLEHMSGALNNMTGFTRTSDQVITQFEILYGLYAPYVKAFRQKHPKEFRDYILIRLASSARVFCLNVYAKKYFVEALPAILNLSTKKDCETQAIRFFTEAMQVYNAHRISPFNFKENKQDLNRLERTRQFGSVLLTEGAHRSHLVELQQYWQNQIDDLKRANQPSLVIKYSLFLMNDIVPRTYLTHIDAKLFAQQIRLQLRSLKKMASLGDDHVFFVIATSQSVLQFLLQMLENPKAEHFRKDVKLTLSCLLKLIVDLKATDKALTKLLDLTLIKFKDDLALLDELGQRQQLYCQYIRYLPNIDKKNVKLISKALKVYQIIAIDTDPDFHNRLLTTAQALAAFHKQNNDEKAAVQYDRIFIETCRQMNNLTHPLLVEALEFENEYLLKNIENVRDLWRAINYYERIIENNQILHLPTSEAIYTAQLNLKVALIVKLIGEGKVKAAERGFSQLDCSDNNDLGTDLKTQLLALRIQIDSEKQKLIDTPKLPISQSPHLFFSDITSTKQASNTKAKNQSPKNKNKKASHKPKAQQIIDANNNNAKPIEKPKYEGGKVGNAVNTRDLSMTLFTVLKPIKEFQALKESNYILYKTLKQAVLEAGTCRDFGDNGLKYLGHGLWEAKVNSKERLLGQVEERDGNKFLVFHTYLKDGFH